MLKALESIKGPVKENIDGSFSWLVLDIGNFTLKVHANFFVAFILLLAF